MKLDLGFVREGGIRPRPRRPSMSAEHFQQSQELEVVEETCNCGKFFHLAIESLAGALSIYETFVFSSSEV